MGGPSLHGSGCCGEETWQSAALPLGPRRARGCLRRGSKGRFVREYIVRKCDMHNVCGVPGGKVPYQLVPDRSRDSSVKL